MSVLSGLFVHRLRQLQVTDDRCRTEVKQLAHFLGYLGIAHRNLCRAVGVDIQGDRFCYADGIADLYERFVSHAGSYQVFGYPSCRIGSRAIHFRGILAAERTATMSSASAVRVHDDLTTRETRVAVRTTDDEITRRVD